MNSFYLKTPILPFLIFILLLSSTSVTSQFLEGGLYNSFIICPEGKVLGHGTNNLGQMGNPEYNPGIVHPQLLLEGDYIGAAAGYDHTLFLHSDSSIWATGSNMQGALGVEDLDNQVTPVQVGTDNDWISVDVADYASFAIKENGTLWGWGTSIYGLFGPSAYMSTVPIQIGLSNKWTKISSNYSHILAIQSDSSLWGWGQNLQGELGIGNSDPVFEPIELDNDKKWIDISAGGNHSLALDKNGKLWATGTNMAGAVGLGAEILSVLTWTQVEPEKVWKAIAAGGTFSAAIRSDGSLWTFGSNQYGELGLGSTEKTTVPAMVGTDKDWIAIAAGETHMLAMKENGDIYSWGDNKFAQLGRASCDGYTYCTAPEKLIIECGNTIVPDTETLSDEPMFYPNPFSKKIFFKDSGGKLQVKIYDVSGQLLVSKDNVFNEMDLSGLDTGIYLIRILGESFERTNLLIRQ